MPSSIPGLAAALAGLFLLAAAPAWAECPGFSAIDNRLADTSCDEVETFSIQVPDGRRQVQIFRDHNLPPDWHQPEPLVRHGIERAAAALRRVGSGRIGDLQVLITGIMPQAGRENRHDDDQGVTIERDSGNTCVMVLYPISAGERDFAFMVAHEFFHCVQYATALAQMREFRSGSSSDWWVEGTAEWFANLAFPGKNSSSAYVAGFDEDSPDTPLTKMSYETVVFFFWYARKSGNRAVIDLPGRMPVSSDPGEQASAAAALLASSDWQRFAEDYFDGRIRYPDGRSIPSNPYAGDVVVWGQSRSQELRAEQLVVHRSNQIFVCGDWTLATQGQRGQWAVREHEGNRWSSPPHAFRAAAGNPRNYLLVAMDPDPDGFHLTIDAQLRKKENCGCTVTMRGHDTQHDHCVTGKWRLVSGGMMKWLDQQLGKINRESGTWDSFESTISAAAPGRVLTIGADGAYAYGTSAIGRTVTATHKNDHYGSRVDAEGKGTGLWSTQDGRLRICALSETSGGTAVLELPNETLRMRMPHYLSEHLASGSYEYECSSTNLHLRHPEIPMPIPMPPMEWTYQRIR